MVLSNGAFGTPLSYPRVEKNVRILASSLMPRNVYKCPVFPILMSFTSVVEKLYVREEFSMYALIRDIDI